MHQLVEDLFPYLVVFYLLDSFVYVRRHQYLVSALLGRSFDLRGAGLHWASLLPTAEALLCDDTPLVVTSQAVHGAEGAIPLAILRRCDASGREIRAGDRTLVEAASPAAARRIALFLETVRTSRDPAQEIERYWSTRYDATAARRLRTAQERGLTALKALSTALWVTLFLLLPAALFAPGERWPGTVSLSAGAAVLYAGVVAVADRMLRQCGLARRARFGALSPLFFFPPAAAHAAGFVARDLYARWDPLTVAAAFLSPAMLREAARRERTRLAELGATSSAETAEHWAVRLRSLEAALKTLGVPPDSLDESGPKEDDSAAAYCPLCATEYRAGFETCADCGVALRAFNGA